MLDRIKEYTSIAFYLVMVVSILIGVVAYIVGLKNDIAQLRLELKVSEARIIHAILT